MSNPEESNGIRWSAKRKTEVVLSLFKGADVTELCRKHGISRSRLYNWRDRFIDGGVEHLKCRLAGKDSRERQVSRLERKVGQLTLQLEILQEVARVKKTNQLP